MTRVRHWVYATGKIPVTSAKSVEFTGDPGEAVASASGWKGISGDGARSIAFWIKTTSEEADTVLYWGQDLSGPLDDGAQNRIRIIGGLGTIELFGRNSSRRSAATTINDGNWHHVVFTWSTAAGTSFGTADCYVDGSLSNGTADTDTAVDTVVDTDFRLGYQNQGTSFLIGFLDDVIIYDFKIPASTVTTLYNSGSSGVDANAIANSGDIVAYYIMGDDPSDTAGASGKLFDQGPNAYHLTTTTNTAIVSDVP